MKITLGFERIRRTGIGKRFAFLVGAICITASIDQAAVADNPNRATPKALAAQSKAHQGRTARRTLKSVRDKAANRGEHRTEPTRLEARGGGSERLTAPIAAKRSLHVWLAELPADETRHPIMLADARVYLRTASILDFQTSLADSDFVAERIAQAETGSRSSERPQSEPPQSEPAKTEPTRESLQTQSAQPAPTQGATKSATPGTVKVEEAAAERALERVLTSSGVLLLPAGGMELNSAISYARMVRRAPALVSDGQGTVSAREVEMRQNQFVLAAVVLFGLPFDSQLEVGLPYRIVQQSWLTPEGSLDVDRQRRRSSAFGDLSVGVAKTFAREHGRWPDLVGRLTWDGATGDEEDDGVALGSGFNELRTSLSAVRRLDPLAIFATLQYEKAFEKHNSKPGDEFGAVVGVSLAASPETALSASLQQAFSRESKVDGKSVTGSDRVAASLLLGASWIVSRGNLLSLSTAAGLTDDAPDYSLSLSWSLRIR